MRVKFKRFDGTSRARRRAATIPGVVCVKRILDPGRISGGAASDRSIQRRDEDRDIPGGIDADGPSHFRTEVTHRILPANEFPATHIHLRVVLAESRRSSRWVSTRFANLALQSSETSRGKTGRRAFPTRLLRVATSKLRQGGKIDASFHREKLSDSENSIDHRRAIDKLSTIASTLGDDAAMNGQRAIGPPSTAVISRGIKTHVVTHRPARESVCDTMAE